MTGDRLLISTQAAARSLGLTDRHVRRLVHTGELVNHGTTRRIRLHMHEVAEYEATRRSREIARMRSRLDGCPLRSA